MQHPDQPPRGDRYAVLRIAEADMVEAHTAYFNWIYRQKPKRLIWSTTLLALVVMIALKGKDEGLAAAVQFAWPMILLWLATYWIMRLSRLMLYRRLIRKRFAEDKRRDDPIEFAWTDEQIYVTAPDSYVRRAWADLTAWSRTDRLLVLFLNSMMFVIPTACLSAAQCADLRDRINAAELPLR